MYYELTVTSLDITLFYLSNVSQPSCFLFINFCKALSKVKLAFSFESSAELISYLLIIVDLVLQCCWYECTYLWNDKLV